MIIAPTSPTVSLADAGAPHEIPPSYGMAIEEAAGSDGSGQS
jgi:hypothetical protein